MNELELKEELRKQREDYEAEIDNRIHEIETEKERSEKEATRIKIKIQEAEDLDHYYNAIKEQEISEIRDRYYLERQMKEDAEIAALAMEQAETADAEDDKKSEVPPSGDDTGCDAEPTLGYTDFDSIRKAAEEEAEEAKKRREEEEAAANAIKEAEEEAKEERRRLEILQQELEEEEEEEKRKAQILAEQNERDW